MALTAAASPSSFPHLDRTIGSEQGTGTFISSHDDLRQLFSGREGQLTHSQIIDDQQRHRFQKLQALFACAVDRGFSQLIEQGVGLAVEHAVALLDGRLADGLGQVALASAGRPARRARPPHRAGVRKPAPHSGCRAAVYPQNFSYGVISKTTPPFAVPKTFPSASITTGSCGNPPSLSVVKL
jgi:hypothetical protein